MAEKEGKEVAIRSSGRTPVLDERSSQLMAMAIALSKSKAVPEAYVGKPDEIFATLEYGRELGVASMLALCNIANIKGKPAMSTNLQLGLCVKRKDWAGYKIVKSDDEECKVVVYRMIQGERFEYPGTFTLRDAVKAGIYYAGGSWDKYRKQMLKMRATGFALRDAFPDVVTGVYSIEEMDPERAAREYSEEIDGSAVSEAKVILDAETTVSAVKPKRKDVSQKGKVAPSAKSKEGPKLAPKRRT